MSVTFASFLELSVPTSGQRLLVGAGPLGLVYREGEQARKLLLHCGADDIERVAAALARLPDVRGLAPVRLERDDGQWVALSSWAPQEATPGDAAEVAALLEALAALHAAGLVHGHLSPPNVRRLHGAPALFDCALWGPVSVGIRAGSWQRYASPERLSGEAPTPADDCFAFGRLLDEWWGDDAAALVEALCRREPGDRLSAAAAAARARLLRGGARGDTDETIHGERFGRYRVVRTLGRGGMGVVHLAVDEDSGNAVALKTVTDTTPRTLQALRWECQCLQALRHPGVARLLDHGTQEGTPWYAMELVRGEPLRDWMSRPIQALTGVLAQLCDTLAWLHGEGLVHGDLKPENVLVTDGDRPVLIDFGLASLTGRGGSRERLAVRTEVAGSVPYMAPEQASSALLDPRVDLYAIGCMLYEAWSGRPPFVGDDAMAILQQHRSAAPEPLHQLAPATPPAIAALVDRLLAKRPEDRPGYASDVAVALRDAVGLPSTQTPAAAWVYRPPLLEREPELTQLRRWLLDEDRPLVWLDGDSGVGKTRLVAELARRLYSGGVDVEVLTCDAGFSAPLAPFRTVLERAGDHLNAGADRERLLGPLGHLLAAFAPGLGPRASAGALRLPLVIRALCHLLTALHSGRLVVLVGDAHHADDLTLAFLKHVAEEAPPRLQVVATWRDREPPTPLQRLAASAPGLTLRPLSDAAVAAAAAGMLATGSAPGALCDALTALSAGNPFYIAEYLRTAAETGQLTRSAAGWRFEAEGPDGPLPASIEALLTARLGRISPDAAAVAGVVALLGVDADTERVTALTGLSPARVFEAVRALRQRDILSDDALLFTNAQNRDVAERMVRPEDRARLHRLAAETLERVEDLDAARVARHWEKAGEVVAARKDYTNAAIGRARLSAYAQSDALFERALSLGGDTKTRYSRACFLLYRTGRYAEALEVIRGVLEEAEAAGDATVRGRALGWLVQLYASMGRLDEAERHMNEALDCLRRDSPAEHAGMLGTIGGIHSWRGRHREAIDCHERALALCEAHDLEQERGMVLSRIAGELRYLGETRRSLELERQALEVMRALGNRFMEGIVLSNVGTALSTLGDLEGCEEHLRQAEAIHRETGNHSSLSVTLFNRGDTAIGLKQHERARGLLEEARALGESLDRIDVSADAMRLLAEIALQTGRRAEAGPLIAAAVTQQRERGLLADLAGSLHTAARIARIIDGDPDTAERFIAEAMALNDGPTGLLLGQCHCERGFIALARSDDARPWLTAAREVLASSEGLYELEESVSSLEAAITAGG